MTCTLLKKSGVLLGYSIHDDGGGEMFTSLTFCLSNLLNGHYVSMIYRLDPNLEFNEPRSSVRELLKCFDD